jgi:hypothetical protein
MKIFLFKNWHLMRFFRLGFGLFLLAQAYFLREWMFVFFGLFLLLQGLFNLGCGAQGCGIRRSR